MASSSASQQMTATITIGRVIKVKQIPAHHLSPQNTRRYERAQVEARAYKSQLDQVYDRSDALAQLLNTVRGWFSPYDSATKWCVLCGAEVGGHTPECPYPKWEDEVLRLIGPA